ncbi:MAG: hypothetical protein U5L72_14690 [Bacteroidales bacterium]|nr:hypothetical protein [Bacteroidales bacterium]
MKTNGRIKLALFLAALMPGFISGQDASTGIPALTSKLDSYRIISPFEELWLHTDRESYVAGEVVRVKAYLLSYPDLRISEKESYAYVELLDYYNNPVAQATIQLVNGSGESEFLLPDSLVTGSYLLRAYTSIMKNYLPHGCFMKKITVANPFREDFLDLYTSLKFSHDPPSKIDFFPEGGRLVSGMLTTVGVTVLNQYGYPAGCSAVVTNGEDEVIAEVTVDTTGIGSFEFIPEPGESYYFTPSVTGQRQLIPPASSGGFNMRVSATGGQAVSILLRGRAAEGEDSYEGGFILIQSRGNILFTRELPPWTGEYVIQVPATRMAKGINNIAAFDATGKFIAERYFYMPEAAGESLHLSYDDHAGRRAKIYLETGDPENRISPDDMVAGSISVAASVTSDKSMTASDYLLLGSEFSHSSDALQLKDNFPWLTPEARNIFLLGIKSEWIDWDRITAGHCDPPLFTEEVNGRYLVASLAGSHEKSAEGRLTAFLAGWGGRQSFQYAKSDTSGEFFFFLERNHETDEIIIKAGEKGNSHPFKPESRFSDRYLTNLFSPDTTPMPALMNELDKMAARSQVRKIYGITDIPDADTTEKDKDHGWQFYGSPDQRLLLDEYVSLSSMREIFFELVRRLTVRSDRQDGKPVIWDPVLKRSPALFIDQVPVDDAETILGLDPAHVKQIDIITGDYLFGEIVFPGILNVITRNGNFTETGLPANILRSSYTMADPSSRFVAPDHSSKGDSRIPDFRNTIFWDGNLKKDSAGGLSVEFWGSDDTQTCDITVTIIDKSGKIISAKAKLHLTGLW